MAKVTSREELRSFIRSILWQKAKEEGVRKFAPREIEADTRFPPMIVILDVFDVKVFDNVLRQVGLLPMHPTEKELIVSLQEFYEEYGRSPSIRDVEMGLLPYSRNVYTTRFTLWNNGLKAAKLPVNEAIGGWNNSPLKWACVTDQDIIDYFRKAYGGRGYAPSIKDYQENDNTYPFSLILRRFRTWQKFVGRTGLKMWSHRHEAQNAQERNAS